jgi:hypothetical protein
MWDGDFCDSGIFGEIGNMKNGRVLLAWIWIRGFREYLYRGVGHLSGGWIETKKKQIPRYVREDSFGWVFRSSARAGKDGSI